MADMRDLALELQDCWASAGQPRRLLEAANDIFQKAVGHRLYTVTRILKDGTEVERLISTNEAVYPVGGRKPVVANAYSERVRGRMEPFLGRTVDDFREFFPDHPTIAGLGLGSVMNLPIVYGGRVLGTANLLDVPLAYDTHHLAPAMLIARQLLPAMLAD